VARPVQPSQLDDQAWAEFLYMRINTKGVYAERWRHSHGCGRFFNALRDTTTDHFLAFYKTGEAQPKISAPASPSAPPSPSASPSSTVPRTPNEDTQ
jgi:sarcosine oxidase subunit delta